MNILYLAAECVPFAKVGGLADVAGALPAEVMKLGHKVTLFLPKYGSIDDKIVGTGRDMSLQKTGIEYEIKLAGKKYSCNLWTWGCTKGCLKGQAPHFDKLSAKPDPTGTGQPFGTAPIYFIENKDLFGKGDVYEGKDLLLKFSLFCHASLEGAKQVNFKPDIINCNDWHTGLIPVILKTTLKDDAFFKNTKTVLSIHNIGYQGVYPPEKLPNTDLDAAELNILKFDRQINLLKCGIETADAINTVSPTYAKEIKTSQYGHGMEIILKNKIIYGILNGADYENWSPEHDKYIIKKYGKKTIKNKQICKANLQKICGLKNKDLFTIGMVTRMVDQKGFDILSEVMNDILKLDLQFIILATGSPEYEKLFKKLQKKYPDKVSVNLRFDNLLAHKIEAGADAFLMPSRYEPCGLNQIYSLKYGTPPIVRKTGGLADTVTNFNKKTGKGNGFVFKNYDADQLLKAVKRAYGLYQNKTLWNKIIKNAMNADFSWKKSAQEYVQMYNTVASR